MVMVDVDDRSLQVDTQPRSVGRSEGRQLLGAVLHSSDEKRVNSENDMCHDDSTVNIVLRVLLLLPAPTELVSMGSVFASVCLFV